MTKEEAKMTREEAIKILKNERGYFCDFKGCQEQQALTMAIKALEQQPCEDCISRQEAINRIEVRRKITCESDPYNYEEWTKGYEEGIDDAIAMINSVPPVTPQQTRWIPVSERLPEEAYGCIVTVMDTNPMTLEEFENIYPDFVGWDGENWNDADGDSIPFEVIAWMPLPQPYEEVQDE